jgi:hypothetical protein
MLPIYLPNNGKYILSNSPCEIKMKNKKYHTVGTFPKSNKIKEQNRHKYMTLHFPDLVPKAYLETV